MLLGCTQVTTKRSRQYYISCLTRRRNTTANNCYISYIVHAASSFFNKIIYVYYLYVYHTVIVVERIRDV